MIKKSDRNKLWARAKAPSGKNSKIEWPEKLLAETRAANTSEKGANNKNKTNVSRTF